MIKKSFDKMAVIILSCAVYITQAQYNYITLNGTCTVH
jgi:hypothetical protein